MFDVSLTRELTEIIGKSLTFTDIETIGGDLFKNYSTHKLENTADNVSISPLNAARRLVSECEKTNRFKDLIALIISLDGNMLNGRIVEVFGLENFLYHISKTGIYFDYGKMKLIDFDQDKKSLINWGSLKDGKEYPIVIASVDICENSKLVKKYKPKVMEQVYYELWEYLNRKLVACDGRIWSWAGDGGILAFRDTGNPCGSICCCMDLLFALPVFNALPSKPIKDDIMLRIGLDSGKIKFYMDTGRIVSDVINYAAHLEKKGTAPNGLSVSDSIYKKLTTQLKNLFKTEQEFEGRKAYSFVFDFKKALS